MGSPAARIKAADFVIPPEFSDRRLAQNEVGRVGGLRLELIHRPETGTSLGDCYQQIPLRVLPPFRFGRDFPALVYLLNPTAGLMDGDGHLVEILARSNTYSLVTGQSATRIHPSIGNFSSQ